MKDELWKLVNDTMRRNVDGYTDTNDIDIDDYLEIAKGINQIVKSVNAAVDHMK